MLNSSARARALAIAATLAALSFPSLAADLSMPQHMRIQGSVAPAPELADLPTLRFDSILADVPVDDRMDADSAFDQRFVLALKEGMSWYLSQRGLRVVEKDEDLRVVANITAYEGWKGWGHWGVEMQVDFKFFHGDVLVLQEPLKSYLKYSDDEDVVREERPKYRASGLRVTFSEILFTRVGIDLSEKFISMMKERSPVLLAPSPVTRKTLASQAGHEADTRGSITIEASVDNAEVLLDGALIGMVPIREVLLSSGEHTLEVRKRGFLPWKKVILVLESASSRFYADLIPED